MNCRICINELYVGEKCEHNERMEIMIFNKVETKPSKVFLAAWVLERLMEAIPDRLAFFWRSVSFILSISKQVSLTRINEFILLRHQAREFCLCRLLS